jgi:Zn-dependent peptidase ImmA (M78 family)
MNELPRTLGADHIHSEAARILKKYKTRDPYELLDAIGAVTRFSSAFPRDGLKGYCTILNRCSYAVINGNLDEADLRVAAGHEAAHLVLHRRQILASPVKAMRDFDLYDSSGRAEREANSFLADFLVPDEDALDAVGAAEDYFAAARGLSVPPPLLAFKLYSMMRRGYQMGAAIDLDSKFLAG